ncbi:hypothetical protein [Dyadobacter luticola]|uniref:Uncharacterized protein n=1 Tax=Dyadobacter luticola TaxID=1979387 RepID=A0A5R9KZ26_9BACT|nr:hypothetical protein [Dyadobacter luticola]TLV01524.1 hypothetical protein FEN17_19050 [Dyadobacter luticola]
MNSKRLSPLLTAAILWLLVGCNKVYDIQEPDTETVPEATITAIKTAYPDAGNFLFKTLLKDKLWKAGFESNASKFETQVSPIAIVADVYKESNNITLYKSLTDKLKVKGGTISGLQLMEKSTDSTARMKYVLDGKSYLLNYYILNDWHIVKLIAGFPAESYSLQPADLPASTVAFCADNSIPLADSKITVNVNAEGKKVYFIQPQSQLYPVIFNDAGELIWIAKNSDGTQLVNKPNNEVGDATLLANVTAGYEDFTTPTEVAFESQFNGLKSVRYVFQKQSGVAGTKSFINELREVFVNATSGEIIYDQYSSYVFK